MIFEHLDWTLRAVEVNGEPWVVASDVARSLGYRMASDLTRRLDDDEKGYAEVRTPGGDQEMTVINEPGLYRAVFGSQVDSAKRFQRWAIHEVLPAVRKTGSYGSTPALPQDYPSALRELAETVERESALKLELEAAAPKVAAHDLLCEADGAISMNDAAKRLGVGPVTLFRLLRENRVLIGEGKNRNLPYQSYAHHFRVTSGTHEEHGRRVQHRTTLVRPSGLSFIAGRLGLVERPVLELVSSG